MKTANGLVYAVAMAPQPGVTRTRLGPPLSPEQAAQFASVFLVDTLTTAELAGLRPPIVCREVTEQESLRRLVGSLVQVPVQSGDRLGDQLEGPFREALADDASDVAVLGAGSATPPAAVLREAFAALAQGSDAVLALANDGGHYLLAACAVHPWLFHEMSWSTDVVGAQTLRRGRTLGPRPHMPPAWYDVDDAASRDMSRTDLRRLPTGTAAHTRAVRDAVQKSALPLGYAA